VNVSLSYRQRRRRKQLLSEHKIYADSNGSRRITSRRLLPTGAVVQHQWTRLQPPDTSLNETQIILYILKGCIVLNEHNTAFTQSGPLYATSISLGHQSRRRNGISIASAVFGELTRWKTDWQTDRPRYSVMPTGFRLGLIGTMPYFIAIAWMVAEEMVFLSCL